MRIFASPDSDPMLLASAESMSLIHEALQTFLASSAVEFELPAKADGDPSPYDSFLQGLRVRKSEGPIVLSKAPNDWLILRGSQENLERYASYFHFPQGTTSGHHHPENCGIPGYISKSSLNLIVEVDSSFEGECAA
jgi:hypothetical protein